MPRLACADVPALPLQLLLRRHPQWSGEPSAVVDKDSPTGRLLWVNEAARRQRVRPGLTYAAALAIARGLNAGVVDAAEIGQGVAEALAALQDLSPRVEPAAGAPGLFWLDASGMARLHPSLRAFAELVRAALHRLHLESRVAVGFSRFGAFAAARAGGAVTVFPDAAAERRFTRAVRLDRLGIDPVLLETLDKLGIRTLGEFLDLPASGVRDRLGPEAHALHALAAEKTWAPLQAAPLPDPLVERIRFEMPVEDQQGVLFLLGQRLEALLAALRERSLGLLELRVVLQVERHGLRELSIKPAAPTLDGPALMNLVVLRFERVQLEAGIEALELHAQGARVEREQESLFRENARRDLRAAARAFARLRAAFGEDAVRRAVLREAHLPEARFAWEPVDRVELPSPREVLFPPLVRRLLHRPVSIAPPPRRSHDDGWLPLGPEGGPVAACDGPFVLSGGWWVREVQREYRLLRMQRGDLLLAYHDARRRRWFLHGWIE